MPKVKKIRSSALAGRAARQEPLGQAIQDDTDRDKYASGSRRQKNRQNADNDGGDDMLDEKSSQRILELSRQQQLEMEAEEAMDDYRRRRRQQNSDESRRRNKNVPSLYDNNSDDEIEDEEEEESVDDDDNFVENDDKGYVAVVEGTEGLSAEDEALVASMMGQSEERRTLADIILEKIDEHEARKRGELDDDDDAAGNNPAQNLPPKVVRVYTEIGKILSHYTAGKLPKAFKIIPSLSNWEDVLFLTRPDKWTPQAMFAATRIFASNLNPKMAQRFYSVLLLDSVRADIAANKKLNYHYYVSLKKAVYKPAAFFKGILLPLCRENDCTLREAAIIASVLQRVSIPVHHSAVAIHKLAQLKEYNGAASIFIKTLLNKKYSLPAPVIGSLVEHFANFVDDDRTLPVLWHQALLVFVQRYKNEINSATNARESLRQVMKKHNHPKITREIRRELFGSQAWKDERSSAAMSTTGGGESMVF